MLRLPPGRIVGVSQHTPDRIARCVVSSVSQAPQPYCSTGPAVSQHCIATRPAAKPSSCHDTSDCIVTLSLARLPPARPRTRIDDRVVASLGHVVGYIVAQPAVSWPTMRTPARLLRTQAYLPGHTCQALCHNIACCIMTHT